MLVYLSSHVECVFVKYKDADRLGALEITAAGHHPALPSWDGLIPFWSTNLSNKTVPRTSVSRRWVNTGHITNRGAKDWLTALDASRNWSSRELRNLAQFRAIRQGSHAGRAETTEIIAPARVQ